jgi:hypothetical protein
MMMGIVLLINPVAETTGLLQTVILVTGAVLVLGGMIITYVGVVREAPSVSTLADATTDDLSLAVKQLSRNYEWIRNQTIYAFYLSAVFMALGLFVLLFGSVRVVMGVAENTDNLTVIAGLISEFISGSALLMYRSSSQRLNLIQALAGISITMTVPKRDTAG